jgi:hypothetical protein
VEAGSVPVNALGRGFGNGPTPRQASRRGSTPRAATRRQPAPDSLVSIRLLSQPCGSTLWEARDNRARWSRGRLWQPCGSWGSWSSRGSGAAAPSGALQAIDVTARPRSSLTFGPGRQRRQSQPALDAHPGWYPPGSRKAPAGGVRQPRRCAGPSEGSRVLGTQSVPASSSVDDHSSVRAGMPLGSVKGPGRPLPFASTGAAREPLPLGSEGHAPLSEQVRRRGPTGW